MPHEIRTCDIGLGTSYERWTLNQLLTHLQSQLGIKSVLEGPGDGMAGIAGINSLILARGGAKVTVVLLEQARADIARRAYAASGCQDRVAFHISQAPEFFPPHPPVDLVWNFNVMPRLRTPGIVLDEMIRITKRYVLIFVPNRANYSFWLHRLHHRVAHKEWDHGPPALLTAKAWGRMLEERGLTVLETLLVDVPWWPDIVDLGQLIQDFFPFLSRWADLAKPENRYRWEANDLPYFDSERHTDFHQRMEHLAFIERSRWCWLKTRFAHHVGVLAEKRGN